MIFFDFFHSLIGKPYISYCGKSVNKVYVAFLLLLYYYFSTGFIIYLLDLQHDLKENVLNSKATEATDITITHGQ